MVQSTVTGSGNIAAGTDESVNFNTSGTLQDVYVHVGQHVKAGQLLADLDPTSAQLSLNQAEESLTAAQDNLNCAEGDTATAAPAARVRAVLGSARTGSGVDDELLRARGTGEYAAFHPGTPPTTKPTTTSQTTGATTTTDHREDARA